MAQAAESLPLYLADTLARQAKLLPDFLQRIASPILKAEAQPQDARLTRGERRKQFFYFFS